MPVPESLEKQITDLLQAGRALTVGWHCGGDESFVSTFLDGQPVAANYADAQDLAVLLDAYLTELLDLPSVGEFDMEGEGRIFRDGADIVIEYQSVANTYWDEDWKEEFTDEELQAMGVARPEPPTDESPQPTNEAETPDAEATDGAYDPEMSADYSGREVLFAPE